MESLAIIPPGQWGMDWLTQQMVNIRSVQRGLACGAVCPNPGCADRLEAKQGRIREWHFAHSTAACEGYRHWTVKRLLAELLTREVAAGRPYLVDIPYMRENPDAPHICPQRTVDLLTSIARVELEIKPFQDNQRRPDITLFTAAGRPAFLIEVVDTHPPSQEVIRQGVPVLTISAQSDESVKLLETQGAVMPLTAYNLPCLCRNANDDESGNRMAEDAGGDWIGYRVNYGINRNFRNGNAEILILDFCRRGHDLIYYPPDTDCPKCGLEGR